MFERIFLLLLIAHPPVGHEPWPLSLDAWSGWLAGVLLGLLLYQQRRLYRFRREAAKREELFRIVTENAADMIALVDVKGRRLYNSPAYEKVLGYTVEELAKTSSFEQIHPEDRLRVLEAARETRRTGIGKKLEYRILHRDGSWRVLESTASAIRNAGGEVDKLVIVNRDITERRRAEEQLEHSSFHDALTGLSNRRRFLERLHDCRARAQADLDYQYAVLLIDVDGFGIFNDTVGQSAGDRMIVEVGRRLETCLVREEAARRSEKARAWQSLLSRLGGDEFTILLEGCADPSDPVRLAKRMQAALAAPWEAEQRQVLATVSIGIALSDALPDRAEDLLRDADAAMRRAKALGGARCEIFDEGMHSRAMGRLQLEADLHEALDQKQFRLYYQPIVHLETRQIRGLEALLRWQHPGKGVVSADKFIEVAEDVGLIVAAGKWVVAEACRQMKTWQETFPVARNLSLTVNLSARQLAHAHLVEDIRSALREAGMEAARLQIEMRESVAMADPRLTFEVLSQLRHLGVRISLGDFGIGFSSLSWLRRFPLDELKIDRSLVNGLLTDRHASDTLKMVITLARGMKLNVVAEGVESVVQVNHLQALGCELGQGYLYSHALEAKCVEPWLQQKAGAAK